MPLIERVLGCANYSEELVQFPMLATPKIDGVRGHTKNGAVYSKSNKLIPNQYIQSVVPALLSDGFDFEQYVAPGFAATTSCVMSDAAPIDKLQLFIFDYVSPDHPIQDYLARCTYLHKLATKWITSPDLHTQRSLPEVHFLLPSVIENPQQLDYFFKECLSAGHEGCVLRKPEGTYKFGKSTVLDQLMLRLTTETTSEARVIGFEEMMHNDNESFISETGRSKKSKLSSGLRPSGILGSFTVRDLHSEVVFSVSAANGLTEEERRNMWQEKASHMNKVLKYSYKAHGTVDKPRQPKFLGFRDERDM